MSNILKLNILPTQCIYVFRMDLIKTVIIFLYSINLLVFITDIEYVSCAVQAGSPKIIQLHVIPSMHLTHLYLHVAFTRRSKGEASKP
jgi:hypothetical protein